MITAPYNFVPLNKEVFFPSWAEDVNHDIPFEDGESGEIDITITAKSPIFVRDHKNPEQFCNYNGQYYIPGSSIKGRIRTVLEIISFAKLKLQDKTLSYRDLNNPSYKIKAMNQNKIYMGWLYLQNNEWKIDSVGKVTDSTTRIKYTQMIKFLDDKIVNKIKQTKEAYKKYMQVDDLKKLQIPQGTIVFTGSTGKKTREFLFPNNIEETIILEKDLIKTFKEAYYIGTTNESKDWKNLWSNKFKNGERIPVFFQKENGNIKHFGLSMLYKLPYENNLQKLLENYQDFKTKLDLSQTIFGYTKNKQALKGRIFFGHFKCVKEIKCNQTATLALSTPRPTFYPNYIVQTQKNGKTNEFTTYDNPNAILRGFKLYPPRKTPIFKDEICNKNKKVCTSFQPLDINSEFKGKIKLHNLKEFEIGALLSSLTFFQKKNYFHKIGMAKAYGFGTVQISINNINLKKDISYYISKFIKTINTELNIDISNHPRIKALLKLSSYGFKDSELKFMDIKEFVNAKKPFNKFVLKEIVSHKYNTSIKQHQQTKTNKNNHYQEIFDKFKQDIKQIYNAFKSDQLKKYKFNRKDFASYLLTHINKNEKLKNSQKKKDIQMIEYLQDIK